MWIQSLILEKTPSWIKHSEKFGRFPFFVEL
jgi:hypothetical protein